MGSSVNIHMSLPRDVLVDFDRAASELGPRRVGLLRSLVERYLQEIKTQKRDEEMRLYAEELAPASNEFVRETDEYTTARWLRETEW
jgi:metal-responsive CopG/Arc/MetJ family transcriptional regulator